MRWFKGSIPDAINSAKQRSYVFVVVITGEDEQSAQLLTSWEDEKVSKAAENCVAIKVDAKSETCVQFSHIYPVVCIPSSFFIGENGIPLEVIAGSMSAEDLIKRINRVTQMHLQYIADGKVTLEASGPLHGPHNNTATEPAQASAPAVGAAAIVKDKADDLISAAVTIAEAASSDHADRCSQADENLDAKVERLTKKLEERREQKKMEEEEKEIRKEIKRRKVGKDLQDFQRKQEEEKTKRFLEERNRDRLMEKAARDRVKQQIALDRAERAARNANIQQEEKVSKLTLLHDVPTEQDVKKKAFCRDRSATARIQFRLPDGSSFTNQFSSQNKLREARQFVVQEVGNRYGNFSLATMFPRREFTSEDLNKTLLELELAPSASIVLLPSGSPGYAVSHSSGGGIWTVLGTLLYPLLAVWRLLSSFLFAAPLEHETAIRGPAPQTSSCISSVFDNAKRETLPQQNLERQRKDYKKDGKVCMLRTQEDSEEDNNTWNGNSTQQM